jgi:hypothetical protein
MVPQEPEKEEDDKWKDETAKKCTLLPRGELLVERDSCRGC